jgi:Fe2+ transport system protein B
MVNVHNKRRNYDKENMQEVGMMKEKDTMTALQALGAAIIAVGMLMVFMLVFPWMLEFSDWYTDWIDKVLRK